MFEPSANIAPIGSNNAPKPRRSRALAVRRIDRRTATGRRILELQKIYIAALGGEPNISPIMRIKIADAAELRGIVEEARAEFIRNGGSLNDLTRMERKAAQSEQALGLNDRKQSASKDRNGSPSLADIVAEHKREAAE